MNYMMGVLHTNASKYGPNYTFNSNNLKSNAEYTVLEQKEKELYSKFGESNFEGFMKKIRQLLGDSQDRKCIANFEANNLYKKIARFANKNAFIFDEEVKIIINSKDVNTKVKILKNLPKGVTVSGDSIYFSGIYNAESVKSMLNKLFSTHFRSQKEVMDYVDSFVDGMMRKGELTIQVLSKESKGKDEYVEYVKNTIPNFPWGATKDDVDKAIVLGKESEIYAEFEKAVEKIKSFILNDLCSGASEDLRRAAEEVWDEHFREQFSAARFFAGGKTEKFISGVQGALGEFQTALIYKYLFKRINEAGLAKIVGNIYKNGEQIKSDIKILDSIGIQVKNYTFGEEIRDISTNIHTKDLNEYFGSTDFLTFLANYFFNSTYQETHQTTFMDLKAYLGNYLGELMNMAVSSKLEDKVTFYFISGKYFVPASHIIAAGNNMVSRIKDSIQITSSWTPLSDEYFAEHDDDGKANFRDYWQRHEKVWYAMDRNMTDYEKLIAKSISIRTNFNPQDLLIEAYKL